MSKVRLNLNTDNEQMLFVEKGIRSGIGTITQRYSKVSNILMPHYNPEEPSNFITYLDCNNLYGKSMMEPLPYSGFQFLEKDRHGKFFRNENGQRVLFDLNSCEASDERGYILEVDIEYPTELHDIHNDYSLAPSNDIVKRGELSAYALHLVEKIWH